LILAGIVGPPWVQWSKEMVSKARDKKVFCTNGGVLYDEGAEPPTEESLEEELDCSQEELDACVLRAADRPAVTKCHGDGDMRFEYVDLCPGSAGAWKADSARNYCVWLLQGPELTVQGANGTSDALIIGEVLVVPKGHEWGLRLLQNAKETALIYVISASITEVSYPQETLNHLMRTVKRPRIERD